MAYTPRSFFQSSVPTLVLREIATPARKKTESKANCVYRKGLNADRGEKRISPVSTGSASLVPVLRHVANLFLVRWPVLVMSGRPSVC